MVIQSLPSTDPDPLSGPSHLHHLCKGKSYYIVSRLRVLTHLFHPLVIVINIQNGSPLELTCRGIWPGGSLVASTVFCHWPLAALVGKCISFRLVRQQATSIFQCFQLHLLNLGTYLSNGVSILRIVCMFVLLPSLGGITNEHTLPAAITATDAQNPPLPFFSICLVTLRLAPIPDCLGGRLGYRKFIARNIIGSPLQDSNLC